MLLRLAIKNLFRNKKRTLLSALAIFFAAFIVIFGYAWMNGIVNTLLSSYQNFQSGIFRILPEEYEQQEKFLPVDIFFRNGDEIKLQLDKYMHEKFPELNFVFAERIRFAGLAGKGEYTGPVVVLGLNIAAEEKRFKLEKNLIMGSVELGHKEVVIGQQLAKNLHLSVGDSLLIATKTYISGLNANKFIVKGIVKFGVETLDKSFVVANIDDAKYLLKLPSQAMIELLVFFDRKHMESVIESLDDFVVKQNESFAIRTFLDDMGPLGTTMEMYSSILLLFFSFIVFLASFVIINSMMMNIFERINELGTLKAQGMFDMEIFKLNFIEGVIMGILGGVPGTVIGFLLTFFMSKNGIDMSDIYKNIDFFMESTIYVDASFSAFLICLAVSIIVPAIATLLPSNYARKLNPVEALRKI